ncbi:putative transposase [Mesorhizobium soli]|uniref:integrase n=1 Tax=Pseudaminobacter soli (ex Li et al. 2025) TaxID=1295366 RepID=UPI002476733F|nr:integrase [Mesorhizobium soli]MDH6231608.1 putative transposase [Mesorhizobium soli]
MFKNLFCSNVPTYHATYGGNRPEVQFLELLFNGRTFAEFCEKVRRIARLREQLFLRYDEECLIGGHHPRSSKTFQTWIAPQWKKLLGPARSDTVNNITAPSVSTFNRLYRRWLKYDRNILAILPRYTGPGQKTPTFTAESLNFAVIEARNFMSRLKPRKKDVFEGYRAALHKANELRKSEKKLQYQEFKKTKFYEIIDSFPAFDVMLAREGLTAALKHFAPNLRSHDEILLGQRIEIDELKTDLEAVWAMVGMLDTITAEQRAILKKIRLWIVMVVDVATRYPLAAKAAPSPNAQAALDTLRLVMSDKTHISDYVGAQIPWIGKVKPSGTAYMDNGSAFLAEETADAFRALRIEVTRPKTGEPKKRPHIESVFHTIGPMFTQFFDGRTFRSIAEKGDYDPKAHASLAAAEFAEIIIHGICDYYNVKGHSALGGRSPHNALVDAVEGYGWMRPPHRMDLIRAFGKPDKATIGRYGIVKYGIPYNNEWLVEQHMERGQKPFDIISDLGYLNSILVKGSDGGWAEVENTIDLPPDLTEREWAEARKEDLAQNRRETEENYVAMRDFILLNRENGKAATLRAGLDPVVPSAAKIEKQRKELYRNFIVAPSSGATIKPDVPLLPPPDDLRGGTVGRSTELKPAPTPAPKTSKFDRAKRDDD